MKTVALAAALSATSAQAMLVEELLASAARIPRNPTALPSPATRRLTGEARAGFRTIRDEHRAAIAAGRRRGACIPERVPISAGEVLDRMNAVTANRRSISVTQALREWMIEHYPSR